MKSFKFLLPLLLISLSLSSTPSSAGPSPFREVGRLTSHCWNQVKTGVHSWKEWMSSFIWKVDPHTAEFPQMNFESEITPKLIGYPEKFTRPKFKKKREIYSPPLSTLPPTQVQSKIQTQEDQLLSEALGLANLGNTCFANSSHKILWKHPQFRSLLGSKPHFNKLGTGQKKLQQRLQGLLTQLDRTSANLPSVSSSSPLLPVPTSINRSTSNTFHKDELTRVFKEVDTVLKERNTQSAKKPEDHFFSKDGERKSYIRKDQQDAAEYVSFLMDELNFTDSHGVQRVSINLDAGKTLSVKADPSTALLHFNLGQNLKPETSMQSLIRDESLGESVADFLVAGKKKTIQRKHFLVAQNPQKVDSVLIALNRFGFDPKMKATKHTIPVHLGPVAFPLYTPQQLSEKEMKKGMPQPTLRTLFPNAVVIHHGKTANSGHYYAYLYDTVHRKWFKHSDQVVTYVSEGEALQDMKMNASVVLYGTR